MTYLLMLSLIMPAADFPICTAADDQYYPCGVYENGQFYVFWADYRYDDVDSSQSVFGARVSEDGTVLDPDGKLLFRNRTGYEPAVAYDGTNFLVVFRDSC
ncbi:MAG: hypothetical protein JSV98_10510 [candidate division WOR-3 bacterium]|nr:MAG: hypothetical protein JSV98_10510 [candidate division WOR-3 bacterium]